MNGYRTHSKCRIVSDFSPPIILGGVTSETVIVTIHDEMSAVLGRIGTFLLSTQSDLW